MTAGTPIPKSPEWLLEEWASRFAGGFEAMAGEPLRHTAAAAPLPTKGETFVWRQPFDLVDGASVEIAIPAAGWRAVGCRILAAAGIEGAGDEDSKPTYLEVLQQSLSGLASALSAAVGREVGCGKGSEINTAASTHGITFEIEGQSFVCGSAPSAALVDSLRPPAPVPAPVPAGLAPQVAAPAQPQPASALELLYDVELPVSVSFGRAHLPVKEVLKLTSGSIVELNRGIAEPVEVIVNNCVIARGEVVVVEGNYGVRILEIVSRTERLRTLH